MTLVLLMAVGAQQEIATAVVKGLQAKLLPAPLAPNSTPHNMNAYSLYLRGQYFARRASDADVAQGIEILKQSVALEPDFAPARKAHPGFRASNYSELRERLLAGGIEVTDDDAIPGVSPCFVADPWGNRIELISAE
jgi:hypothetical protein